MNSINNNNNNLGHEDVDHGEDGAELRSITLMTLIITIIIIT